MPIKTKPWRDFRVDPPGEEGNGCLTLAEIFHVAHLETAHRIIVDGKMRSGLIFDESKLKKDRIQVTWLSPNYWHHGFRYGSVRFTFDWPMLVADHRAYWVESIPYKPKACRILLTKKDHSNHPVLLSYDPTVGDGPWWLDEASGTHYWNGNYCLEFMIEDDLELSGIIDLDFVNHHPNQCKVDHRACPEKGMAWFDAASRFLSRLAAENISLPSKLWAYPERLAQFRRSPESAMKIIKGKLGPRLEFNGAITANSPNSIPIGRAILHAYANTSLRSDIPALAALFRSREDALACCSALINSVVESPPSS